MAEVKVHGAGPSPFSYRVILALKLKGIPYEYIEEDLFNKSALLLKYNPVYKKIPVLVHGENPICESIVILQYIEDMWPQNPLMPSDPYDKAVARFWIQFIENKGDATWKLFCSTGEEVEKAMKETLEMIQTVEEHGLGENKFFNGDKIGFVDLAFFTIFYRLQVIEDLVGVRVFESHKFPGLYAWFENFKQVPVIGENLPTLDEMLLFYKPLREKMVASA